ncbi:MAG: regulatory protein TetR [Acidimicrobiales bacterium]|nr:regulatory protein TetR [Acidimicrobiales bacterium]
MTPATSPTAVPAPTSVEPAARRRARRGEGDRTREAIISAAEALLTASGSEDAVSIRAVADAVGVTPPSIYRHFPDKAHLIFEVCARHFDAIDAALVQPILRAGGDPVEALAELARGYVRFGVENPEHYRIMFMGHADHTPGMYASERVLETGSFGGTAQLVQRAIDAGRLRADAGDAVLVTYVIWAALHGVVTVAVSKPNMPAPPLDAQVDAMIDTLLHGLLA